MMLWHVGAVAAATGWRLSRRCRPFPGWSGSWWSLRRCRSKIRSCGTRLWISSNTRPPGSTRRGPRRRLSRSGLRGGGRRRGSRRVRLLPRFLQQRLLSGWLRQYGLPAAISLLTGNRSMRAALSNAYRRPRDSAAAASQTLLREPEGLTATRREVVASKLFALQRVDYARRSQGYD